MSFNQDWFMRQAELLAEGVARKLLGKPSTHHEFVDVKKFGADDLLHYRLRALLARRELCAAEDLLWDYLYPGDPACLALAEEFYRLLDEYSDYTLEAHNFTRAEVREGLERAKEYIGE